MNTLNQLPEELNVFKVTTRENETTVGFFGEINPLSNFHLFAFSYEGVQYISSEQFIQASKAKYFGDVDSYNQIMSCSISLECKSVSRQIRNVEAGRWENVAGEICQPGIPAKFLQNSTVMDTLIHQTAQKNIVECTSDRLWGTGIPLNDPLCLDPSKWITQGIMGQILEGIHDEALQNQYLHHHPHTMVFAMTNNPHHPIVPGSSSAQGSATTTHTISLQPTVDSIPEHPQFSLALQMGNVADSESASTTPASDTTETTTSDGESNIIHTKQSELQAVPMEGTAPT